MSTSKKPQLIDAVMTIMRLRHYSIHTERAYCDWIRRYVRYHQMQKREDLFQESAAKVEAFLSHLALHTHVAASTQHQAMHTLVFLYKQVLKAPLEEAIEAVRAKKKVHVPEARPGARAR